MERVHRKGGRRSTAMSRDLRWFAWAGGAVTVLALALLSSSPTQAWPNYVNQWESLYPSSMTDDFLVMATSTACQICHVDISGGQPWNTYGWSVRQQIQAGMDPLEAFVAVEQEDSDEDPTGCSNIAEIEDGTQPGWRTGATNIVYFADGSFLEDEPPPAVPVDPLEPCCPADVDGDGMVGVTDLLDLLAAWGPNPGHPADLDGNGVVNTVDMLGLLAQWGECP